VPAFSRVVFAVVPNFSQLVRLFRRVNRRLKPGNRSLCRLERRSPFVELFRRRFVNDIKPVRGRGRLADLNGFGQF